LNVEVSFLGTLGTLSIIILFYILAKLSKRLGSVEKMAPLYRYYYVAQLFMGLSYIIHLLVVRINFAPENFPNWLISPWFLLLAYQLPLTIAATLGLIVTWRYWSWLVIEPKS
jgi:hypothetical protein